MKKVMAKKVNKRNLKSGNSQLYIKKERQNDRTSFKKLTSENDPNNNKSFISRTFSSIDAIRPFPIAVLGLLYSFHTSHFIEY